MIRYFAAVLLAAVSIVLNSSCRAPPECEGRWSYKQFAYFPSVSDPTRDQWTHQLELKFSQKESVSHGADTEKFLRISIRDSQYNELFSDCLVTHGRLLEANVFWENFRSIKIDLLEVKMDLTSKQALESRKVNSLIITKRDDSSPFELHMER